MAKPKKNELANLPEWQRNYQPPKDGFSAEFAKAMVATLRASAPAQKPGNPRGPR